MSIYRAEILAPFFSGVVIAVIVIAWDEARGATT